MQPAGVPKWQVPSEQESAVQAFESLQSAPVVQGMQPGAGAPNWQVPLEQVSAVQAFESLQSPLVVQGMQPGAGAPK